MALMVSQLLTELDALIQEKHLLKHPFYQAWSRGELSHACLKEYAQEYYHHVKAFPTYISALHSRSDQPAIRRSLLKNLIEEEAGNPNHPDLWRDFAKALGSSEEELSAHQPNSDIQKLISTFQSVCRERPIAEGIAALYSYESQIPEICISKIDGLKKHYGMTQPKDWAYFQVHIAADQEHAQEERALLETQTTPENFPEIKSSADYILTALQQFLTGLCHRHHIVCPS
jgi:pyrroloquinoline-quinone synthase